MSSTAITHKRTMTGAVPDVITTAMVYYRSLRAGSWVNGLPCCCVLYPEMAHLFDEWSDHSLPELLQQACGFPVVKEICKPPEAAVQERSRS